MQIRKLKLQDVDAVLKLGQKEEAFAASSDMEGFWPRSHLESMVDADQDVLLVAEEDGSVIGFVLCFLHKPSGKATIENIFVCEDSRRNGVANSLLQEALTRLKDRGFTYVVASVEESNKSSQDLFEASDFNKEKKFFWMDKEL